ncbi:MAG: wax ester/triacylglycerol synthase family O-acyltransferase [Myxococcales bacterium]
MKAVEPSDQLFLFIERRQQPMHVGGLQLFSLPEGAGPKFVLDLVEQLRAFRHPSPPFNKRLVSRFGASFWEEDTELDLDLHLRHGALPQPGRVRELLSLVSAEHSILLDRERPLWETHLIEGLSQGRFAMYTKVHHGLMDGISVMRLGMQALSHDPNERNMPPFWALPRKRRIRDAEANVGFYTDTTARYLGATPAVLREAFNVFVRAQRNPDSVGLYAAPHCKLSEKITGSRRVACQSYSLTRVKAIAKVFGATVNDVVLGVCSSALRGYLMNQNALPDKPLIAMVPMSIRKDDSAGGNQFAVILTNLGTHLSDPVERLRVIKNSVDEAKTRYAQMNNEESSTFSAMALAPVLYNLFTGLRPKWMSFNVVISNVPGPEKPLYMNGARLEGMYPVSIVHDHNALNITFTSYRDQLEFGVVGCRRTLPSMQRLLDHIERAITEFERAAGLGGKSTPVENATKWSFLDA